MDRQKERVPLGEEGALAGPTAGTSTQEYKLKLWYWSPRWGVEDNFSVKFDARSGSKGSFSDRFGVQRGPQEGFGHSCHESRPQVPKFGGKWKPKGAPMEVRGSTLASG